MATPGTAGQQVSLMEAARRTGLAASASQMAAVCAASQVEVVDGLVDLAAFAGPCPGVQEMDVVAVSDPFIAWAA